ncbi:MULTISPECIES: KGK domain-containing protein [unclassified Nodularia (in: cyanobacteria)]|uniref:KGK domain-containing protein n=1 Tax=unclassified Nodularia (in: cyanobacteria) TaxID=2656917 RepID=UPI0018822DD1|nr:MULTISPECIES: KGK domain-containing protein [unclassified Nodularia (in: cyanobacteria)]MBE9201882.1 KGK domain-containing protein [Nodularia sp. LEGE 06071]MCC2693151.1 KGK domain-containing protein [Nodularia sp. LEGE 04288]
MSNKFEHLNHNEVVSVKPETFNNLDVSQTFKVSDLLRAIMECVEADNTNEAPLYSKGLNCEVLKLGAMRWQTGKIRLCLEFCPDEAESPLDDMRQQLKQVEN